MEVAVGAVVVLVDVDVDVDELGDGVVGGVVGSTVGGGAVAGVDGGGWVGGVVEPVWRGAGVVEPVEPSLPHAHVTMTRARTARQPRTDVI